jgi:hypothetical protein
LGEALAVLHPKQTVAHFHQLQPLHMQAVLLESVLVELDADYLEMEVFLVAAVAAMVVQPITVEAVMALWVLEAVQVVMV